MEETLMKHLNTTRMPIRRFFVIGICTIGLVLGGLKEIAMMTLTTMNAVAEAAKPRIDEAVTKNIATATFALGWFWGPDARFGSIKGVVRTRVGYSGGTKKHPTYHDLGDHSETIQIDYDPTQITYEELLNVFWESHSPVSPAWSRQYMSAIFYHNEEQKRLALKTKKREEAKQGTIYTKILPISEFYLAEDYHQRYTLRQWPEIMREFSAMYPNTEDFINSTAAARVNGYLAGYGSYSALQEEIDSLGLSEEAKQKLLKIVKN